MLYVSLDIHLILPIARIRRKLVHFGIDVPGRIRVVGDQRGFCNRAWRFYRMSRHKERVIFEALGRELEVPSGVMFVQ